MKNLKSQQGVKSTRNKKQRSLARVALLAHLRTVDGGVGHQVSRSSTLAMDLADAPLGGVGGSKEGGGALALISGEAFEGSRHGLGVLQVVGASLLVVHDADGRVACVRVEPHGGTRRGHGAIQVHQLR